MTRLLSFDVGVTNLAFCLVEFTENEHKIIDWGVIDVMESFEDRKIKCSVVKNGVICNSDAVTYVEVDDKQLGFCNKKNCQSIVNSVYSKKQIKKTKKVNTKTVSLFDIAKSMMKKLYEKPNLIDVNKVVIENQPVLKNPTMKSIQMILYSFFIMNGALKDNILKEIVMFNARGKLDIYDGPKIEMPINIKKDSYKDRKYRSIEYTKYFLRDENTWLDFFNKHKKKDDLADAYLQCLTYYKKNYKNA